MNIDSIQNGIVLDHIAAGKALQIYNDLHLDKLDCSVAIIKNVKSQKMGKKDILKIDQDISVNIFRDGKLVEKKNIELPERLVGIKKCTNPRCITSTEQGIQHIFKLTDRAHRIYRCIYCEADK